ncbi:MAG: AAA family ATPase [Bacteroidales bacterium]|nr:AAA family ATPase [Bacteroidales bacterium]
MKISAFHIRNYRSIIDSGKCYLSPDNITALIGQNESGKTSVLEALRSFYESRITDDVLRSDQTFPEITCTFLLEENDRLDEMIDFSRLPAELHDAFRQKTEITLNRKWLNSRKNVISVAEPELLTHFEALEKTVIETDQLIARSFLELIKQTENSARDLHLLETLVDSARKEVNTRHNRLEDLKHIISRSKRPDERITAEQELETTQQQQSDNETNLKEKLIQIEHGKAKLKDLAEKLNTCKLYHEISGRVKDLVEEAKVKAGLIHDAEHQYELCSSEKENRLIIKRLEQLRTSYNYVQEELRNQTANLSLRRKITSRVLDGKDLKESEIEAVKEYEQESGLASLEEMGQKLFNHVPLFEFFEDFSSLLPNKIDLEDLLNENTHAEGYKAARNFLCVAGLNADFFREKNHRILKQKIENLNSEITIDFQDYWRQNVGKNDKIRINFELEHYDYTQPEKSGKPYLEFWIKDKQERLYPKQRSRGVRWFLSFYLELKATAKENTRNRVMLIDEPGLSLHARAQEDVLKVFEDLRENLQIIYCTHSPSLIDIQKLYRIIAVQRAKDNDEKSETVVLDARSLHEASTDTLSPIYSLMGTRLNDKQFIFPKNNIIVEDNVTYYYLDSLSRLYGFEDYIHFIPASGPENIPMLANILFGWKIDFGVLTMDNPVNAQVLEFLRNTTFFRNDDAANRKIRSYQGFTGIEDLFSTIDFKRFILQQRIGITVRNSEFIISNGISRLILATDFCSKLQKDGTVFKEFDDETKKNFDKLFRLIKSMAEPEPVLQPSN